MRVGIQLKYKVLGGDYMKKIGKLIPILVCGFLLASGSALAVKGLTDSIDREAQATTDHGNYNLTYLTSSTGETISAYDPNGNSAPSAGDWTVSYTPVGGSGGCFINGVDAGALLATKVSQRDICFRFSAAPVGKTFTEADAGSYITLKGTWQTEYEGEVHTFTISPTFSRQWTGTEWVPYYDYDLEDYDLVSMRDCGMRDYATEAISTEDGYNQNGLRKNGFAPTSTTNSWAFQFKFKAEDAMDDQVTIRVGCNGAWATGHNLRLRYNNTWGPQPGGAFFIEDCNDDAVVQSSGEIDSAIVAETTYLIEFGLIKIKNSSNYLAFLKKDGWFLKACEWTIDASDMTTRVSINYPGADCSFSNSLSQFWGNEALAYDSNPSNPYFSLTYDPIPEIATFGEYCLPYEDDNILYNGAQIAKNKANYFKKVDAKKFYFGLGTDLFTTPVAGDTLTIRGAFKFVTAELKIYKFSVLENTWVFDGETWNEYALDKLQTSTADQLEEGNLLLNIGRTRPDSNHASSVKQFDQGVVWDENTGEEIDTLVYKKDANNHTGIYFTSSDSSTHGEYRVYFPQNGYKTETKAYAMTQLTFDYIYENEGTITAQDRNHSLTEDGYYVPAPASGSVINNFTVQALVKYCKDGNMYHDIEVELINDGCLHSVTVNLAYSEVMGFAFVLWNFDGTFFMSNVHADYQEYNANLESFVGNSLKMYSYVGNGQCADYYAGAKTAYAALTADEKALFANYAGYGSAKARLEAWARANGETFDAAAGTFTPNGAGSILNLKNNNNVVVIVVASTALIAASLLGVLLVLRKRRYSK